jgi:hypothetical protein
MTMSDEREEGDQPEPGETRRGLPVLAFSSPTAWRAWLETRHASSKGL